MQIFSPLMLRVLKKNQLFALFYRKMKAIMNITLHNSDAKLGKRGNTSLRKNHKALLNNLKKTGSIVKSYFKTDKNENLTLFKVSSLSFMGI